MGVFFAKNYTSRFAHKKDNLKKFPFWPNLTSSKESLTRATRVANLELASFQDLSQSKGDEN
jgi:hypothetical protein